MPVDKDKVNIIRGDKEEIGLLRQNLYLVYLADREYAFALNHINHCIDIFKEIHPNRSIKLASKYYQKSNCLLHLNQKEEAIKWIRLAIDIQSNPDTSDGAAGD